MSSEKEPAALAALEGDYEIIIVDDGQDNTREMLEAIGDCRIVRIVTSEDQDLLCWSIGVGITREQQNTKDY